MHALAPLRNVRRRCGLSALGLGGMLLWGTAALVFAAPLPTESDPPLASDGMGPALGATEAGESDDESAPADEASSSAEDEGAAEPAPESPAADAEPTSPPADDAAPPSAEDEPADDRSADDKPAGDESANDESGDNQPADDEPAEVVITDEPAATTGSVNGSAVKIVSPVEPDPAATPPGAGESPSGDEPAAATSPALPPLSPELVELREQVRKALAIHFRRHLNTAEHNPWEMMHGVIAYGVDSLFRRNGPSGEPVNAVAYLSINGAGRGIKLLYVDGQGRLRARQGLYVQGHEGQLLAILAQCHVPADYPFTVEGRKFTLRDLIRSEMETCQANTELTFKLISLAHYLHTDDTWRDERGGQWSIARLIQEEIRQPILKVAACGGTHRLMGLIYSVHKRQQHGRPIDGQFQRALQYTQDYHRYAFALQNPDGSFSTKWFERPENKPDVDRKLKTSGHVIEWLTYSLPSEQLSDPRVQKAVRFLSGILVAEPERAWEIGPKCHALHALRIYDRRLFKPHDAPTAPTSQPLGDTADDTPPAPVDSELVPALAQPPGQPVSAAPTLDALPDSDGPVFQRDLRERAAAPDGQRPRTSTVRLVPADGDKPLR